MSMLVGGLLLLACGCGGSAGAGDVAEAADAEGGAAEGLAEDGGGDLEARGEAEGGEPEAEAEDGGREVAAEDGGREAEVDAADAEEAEADAGPSPWELCFAEVWDPTLPGPDYMRFDPVLASHCYGTNHQDITGVERVVFLGDSITVGSPPTLASQFYRVLLAHMLAERFGLTPPSFLWEQLDIINGQTLVRSSGDFWSCAKWGARTDDLMRDNTQVVDCFPEEERSKRTLVVMTIGGNDIAALTKDLGEGVPIDEVRANTEEFVQLFRETVQWFTEDPARFPAGVFVIFSNMYEFTDATGDISACPAADLGGFTPVTDPVAHAALEEDVIWANEQYMSIAVETGTDMILPLEHFCGHGYRRDDPEGRCYRGPGAELWFDLTCYHPNPTGHAKLAEMFMAVVDE
jgi:lysophospholipase L1-like esterase